MYTQLKQHVQRNATIWGTDAVVCLTEQRLEVVQFQILAQQSVCFTVDIDQTDKFLDVCTKTHTMTYLEYSTIYLTLPLSF